MTVCDSSMCPLRCPDRTAIRPGGGSARRDAGARDRGERASERGARGLKREISLSLSLRRRRWRARAGAARVRRRARDRTTVRRLFHPRARARERDAGDAGDATRGESRRRNGTSGDV